MGMVSKVTLSGSANGRLIKVAATATPGTLIHTAQADSGPDNQDEIYLFAVNSDSADRKLTIEFGGTGAPDDLIEKTIKFEDGLYMIVPGLPLNGGVIVRAFCASANVVMIGGFVNRMKGQ